MPPVQHIIVTPAEAGLKLIGFLERRLAGQVPRSAMMRWIRTGQVRVDKGRAKPFDRLGEGAVVRVPPFEADPGTDLTPDLPAGELDIVYSDDVILLVNKPQGLPVQPGSKQADAVSTRLKALFPDAPFPPTPAHRLDKDTSGLVVVARTFQALSHLHQLWRSGLVAKTYLCWVQGRPNWPEWTTLSDMLDQPGKRGRVLTNQKQGKPAQSSVKVLETRGGHSLLAVRLLQTGRKHQIRVQLASRNHPIIGDCKYAGPPSRQGMLLHACHVGWEDRCFYLPPPWKDQFSLLRSNRIDLTVLLELSATCRGL